MVSRWLCPGNRPFLEVANMVVSWWIVAFLPSSRVHVTSQVFDACNWSVLKYRNIWAGFWCSTTHSSMSCYTFNADIFAQHENVSNTKNIPRGRGWHTLLRSKPISFFFPFLCIVWIFRKIPIYFFLFSRFKSLDTKVLQKVCLGS